MGEEDYATKFTCFSSLSRGASFVVDTFAFSFRNTLWLFPALGVSPLRLLILLPYLPASSCASSSTGKNLSISGIIV